ncbi:hypothetical protein DFP72DRAFT_1169126 [Ephemerocybe angulata]|uniref:Uncharacterized protein n=1 Tax=Ephemerocybe angulata TaxID=980116 RepID=A0A8H6M8M1_9AGAR|nr:hypothetical protein DFP72DRAFT_1169126 [Tulosesus angulatus]
MGLSQDNTTASQHPPSPQSKIPRRTSSRTQPQHPSRKSSVSASGSASTSLAPTAPAPWLMRRTSHASLRGGKSASTTSLSVPGSGGGGMGGTSPAAAPVASVTVVFAEGTGAPPSLSAEESVGMLAGLTASPSSSSSASTHTSSPVSVPPTNSGPSGPQPRPQGPSAPSPSTSPSKTSGWFASLGRSKTRSASSASNTNRPGISQRALDKRPATREEEDGLPPIMRITDLFPGEGLPGGSATGSTPGQMGVTTSGTPPSEASTSTGTDVNANAIPAAQVQEQDDDADSAIGLSESPTFTTSPLPFPLSPAEDVQPEPTPSIPIPITVTPPAPLDPSLALSPPPLPSPPILPSAYTSNTSTGSTPGSTPRKRSWFYTSRSASASAPASNSSLVGSPPVSTSPLSISSRLVVGSEPLIARLPVPLLPGVGVGGVEAGVGALEEEVVHPQQEGGVTGGETGGVEFDALSPSMSKLEDLHVNEKEKEKEQEREKEKEAQAKSYPSSIDDFVPPLPLTPAVEVPNINVEGVLELEDVGRIWREIWWRRMVEEKGVGVGLGAWI